jgi:hypothetical protein
LRPWLVDTFRLSNDSEFEARLVDVVGFCLDPPEWAVVFSFDKGCSVKRWTEPTRAGRSSPGEVGR